MGTFIQLTAVFVFAVTIGSDATASPGFKARITDKGLKYGIKNYLNPFLNKPWFLRVCSTRLLKKLGKGEIARNEQFLLFPQCFLSFRRIFFHFI